MQFPAVPCYFYPYAHISSSMPYSRISSAQVPPLKHQQLPSSPSVNNMQSALIRRSVSVNSAQCPYPVEHTNYTTGTVTLSDVYISLRGVLPSQGFVAVFCPHLQSLCCFDTVYIFFFFYGATARGGPWPPLQYVSKPLDPLLYLSIRLYPSFSGP
jgi:hypothetical protein